MEKPPPKNKNRKKNKKPIEMLRELLETYQKDNVIVVDMMKKNITVLSDRIIALEKNRNKNLYTRTNVPRQTKKLKREQQSGRGSKSVTIATTSYPLPCC